MLKIVNFWLVLIFLGLLASLLLAREVLEALQV
jgi:hypothetical protein